MEIRLRLLGDEVKPSDLRQLASTLERTYLEDSRITREPAPSRSSEMGGASTETIIVGLASGAFGAFANVAVAFLRDRKQRLEIVLQETKDGTHKKRLILENSGQTPIDAATVAELLVKLRDQQ